MRRITLLGGSLAAGLVLLLPAGAAQGAEVTAGGGSPRETVIRLTATMVQASYQGPAGFTQGATLVFSEALSQKGVTVGRDGGVCTVTATRTGGTGDAECGVTASLPAGDITWQGLLPVKAATVGGVQRAVLAHDFKAAVTGGTGRYDTARGFLTGHPVDERTTQVEIHVIR